MRSLTYVSSARHQWEQAELEELLNVARQWNAPRSLTGMLLYSGGNFIQSVEGEEDAITEVFARIHRDRRHHGILVLLDENVEQRSFPDFSMGFRRVSAGELNLEGYSDFLQDPAGSAELGHARSAPMVLLNSFRATVR